MHPLYALDLGTTKFCIAKMEFGKQSPLEITTCESRGMKRGMLSNFSEVSEGIESLIHKAEQNCRSPIRQVIMGVAGYHLKSYVKNIDLELKNQTVTKKIVKHLKSRAMEQFSEPGREILHILPTSYTIDQRSPTLDPVGQSGNRIEVKYFMIDCDQLYLRDLLAAANQSGLEVISLYAEPFASSCVTVPSEFKSLGIAIADIGGGTTDGIVFSKGIPVSCFTFNIGGLMMTNDIAIGLNIPQFEAEKVKSFFGLSASKSQSTMSVIDNKKRTRIVHGIEVQKILSHRVLEWSEQLAQQLFPYKGMLGSGIQLTGGGSLILNFAEVLEHQFSIPVCTTVPSIENASTREKFAAKYATVIGLLQLEAQKRDELNYSHNNSWKTTFFRSIAGWIKELS